MESQVLIPIQQLLVLFHGYQILAVRLPDNRIAASLRALCRMLNLSRNGQMERIRRDKNLAEHLLLARVEIAHKPQYMDVLVVEAIPSWALGLHLNLISLEKRPLVLALQVEAVHAFHRAFFPEAAEPSAKTARKHSSRSDGTSGAWVDAEEPATTLDSPFEVLYAALDDAKSALDSAKRALHGIEREQEQRETQTLDRFTRMEKYGARVEARLAQLEQRAGHTIDPEADQAAPDNKRILSPLHLVQVSVLARSLRARTGERIDVMMADLAETFGVEDVSDIPDAGWEHVRSWFWQRLCPRITSYSQVLWRADRPRWLRACGPTP